MIVNKDVYTHLMGLLNPQITETRKEIETHDLKRILALPKKWMVLFKSEDGKVGRSSGLSVEEPYILEHEKLGTVLAADGKVLARKYSNYWNVETIYMYHDYEIVMVLT